MHAYSFAISSLNLLQNYLSNYKERTKVESFFNFWEYILSGVPQGSILDPPLFNIFMRNMFLILKTVCLTSYPDDNSTLGITDNTKDVIRSLEEAGENLITWFSNNEM